LLPDKLTAKEPPDAVIPSDSFDYFSRNILSKNLLHTSLFRHKVAHNI